MVPVSGLEAGPLAPLCNRLGAAVFRHGEHFYNFWGLRAYKEKFEPVWESLYLVTPVGLAFPRILSHLATLVSGGVRGGVRRIERSGRTHLRARVERRACHARPRTAGAMNHVEHLKRLLMNPTTALSLVALFVLVFPAQSGAGDAVRSAYGQAADTAVSGDPGQDRSFGSTVPCAVPLEWRIADVDPRFEVDDSTAGFAVEEAASLWERAVDRQLFSHEPGKGLPVRFVFDDRQALLQVRRQLQRDLEDAGRRLEARRTELGGLRDTFREALAEHEERSVTLQRQLEDYDAAVRRWNARGGAPDSVRADLHRRRADLQAERRSLEKQQQEMRALQEWFRAQTEALNQRIRDQNRRAEALQREFPVVATEAGRYGESVRRRNGEVVSVEREVLVFRFSGMNELVLLLAHELGHALGLGHSGVRGSVMHEVSSEWSGASSGLELHRSDVEMLLERCPDFSG